MRQALEMRLLVVGGSGFLGQEIVKQAHSADATVDATYRTSVPGEPAGARWHHVDIRQRDGVVRLLAECEPDVIINASADLADWAATARGPAHLALAAQTVDARFVQVSSDAVFSGAATTYDESSEPDPISPYGAAKAAAETAVIAIASDSIVARTSLIFGNGRSKHERLVHDLALGTRDGKLFTDDVKCPVHVSDLAAALLELATSDRRGVHHLGGADAISRWDQGVLIAKRAGLDVDRLRPGRRAGSGTPGPVEVILDSRATQASLTTRLRGAREFLSSGG